MSIDALLAAQKVHRLRRLYGEADRLGVHRQSWVRLSDMADALNGDPLARAVMEKIRDAHLYDSTSTAVVLSSLLADVIDVVATNRKVMADLAAGTFMAPTFIHIKDNKDDHNG